MAAHAGTRYRLQRRSVDDEPDSRVVLQGRPELDSLPEDGLGRADQPAVCLLQRPALDVRWAEIQRPDPTERHLVVHGWDEVDEHRQRRMVTAEGTDDHRLPEQALAIRRRRPGQA